MHDCRKSKNILVDLVFGELESIQHERALAEVRSCPSCRQEYQSLLATLRVFDQAAEAAMPDEHYWAGYQARLRAKLAEPVAATRGLRLAGWFAGLLAKPTIPVAVAAGLILIAAISAAWISRQNGGSPQAPRVLVAETSPTPSPSPSVSTPEEINKPKNDVQPERQSNVVAVKPAGRRQMRSVAQPSIKPRQDVLIAANPQPATSPVSQAYVPPVGSPVGSHAAHFEMAELLLRSFRNARPENKGEAYNLAYEKQQSNKLIYDNVLLRREAEAKGYLPVEEALNSLEPLLLDIANLPDKASRTEVQAIKDRIQKQEIIATLQIVSSGAERLISSARLK